MNMDYIRRIAKESPLDIDAIIYAIYVHNTRAIPYADAIISGLKPIETRTRDVLKKFVGHRVLVIRTEDGKKPLVIGSVFIRDKAFHNAETMDFLRFLTCIPVGSKFDCNGKGKWCYYLSNPVQFADPIPLDQFTIVSRTRSHATLAIPS